MTPVPCIRAASIRREYEKVATTGNDARETVLRYVRARTFEGQPVCGVKELEEKAHVHHRTAGPVVAQLRRDKLIEDEPEKIGRGDPKPRLWALTTADFTAPPRPGRAQ
jgi:hypothetical protein